MSLEGDIKDKHKTFLNNISKVAKVAAVKEAEAFIRTSNSIKTIRLPPSPNRGVVQNTTHIHNLELIPSNKISVARKIIHAVCCEHGIQYKELTIPHGAPSYYKLLGVAGREATYMLHNAGLQYISISKLFMINNSTARKRVHLQEVMIKEYVASLGMTELQAMLREIKRREDIKE